MSDNPYTQIDRFLAFHSSRSDNWRAVVDACEAWAGKHCEASEVQAALANVAVIEEFHAVPGIRLMRELRGPHRPAGSGCGGNWPGASPRRS